MPRRPAFPPILELLQDLELLAGGGPHAEAKYAPGRGTRAQKRHRVETAFELAVATALEAAGFRTRRLGSKKPGQRKPDAIAFPPVSPKYALVVDAKVAAAGYSLPAKDQRALAEYAKKYSRQLRGIGCEKLHLLVISSSFPGDYRSAIESIKQGCRDTILDRVYLVPARLLREIVLHKLSEARLGEPFLEELFVSGPDVFDSAHVQEARVKIGETF